MTAGTMTASATKRRPAAAMIYDADGSPDAAGPGIGRHLRMARMARGFRLKDVADAAGCSEGLLSRIENDKADPSLKLLQKVCAFLTMKVGDLISWAEKRDAVVIRAADRAAVHFGNHGGPGTTIEHLSMAGHLITGYINRLAPGGSTGDPLSHVGEELGIVTRGDLELLIGETVHQLSTGDSFCFRSDIPHSYRNTSSIEAEVIIVNSPPSF